MSGPGNMKSTWNTSSVWIKQLIMQILKIINSKDWIPSNQQYFSLTESSFYRRPFVTSMWILRPPASPAALDSCQSAGQKDAARWHQWYWRETASGTRHGYVSSLQLSIHIWAPTLDPCPFIINALSSEDARQGGSETEYLCFGSVGEMKVNPWPWEQVLLLHHQRGKRVKDNRVRQSVHVHAGQSLLIRFGYV